MPIGSTNSRRFSLFEEYKMKGYVMQLRQVAELSPEKLADRVGFAHHLMAEGYALFLLTSHVARQDFLWRDRTRFSAGWVKERVYFKEQNRLGWSDEYVQRADQDRFTFWQSERYQSEAPWEAFMAEQLRALNIRQGGERIVKVVPFVKGTTGDYPDAEGDGALQWELMVEKQFRCVALAGPERTIRQGEFDASYGV